MPQQPPHYTLIIRLPFPRPPNSAFDSIPQPQTALQQPQPQTAGKTLAPTTTTPPKTSTPPIQPPKTSSNPHSPQPTQHHPPPPPHHASATTSPAPAPSSGRSEGTPSMGSSFSDLSGASVAQSALEEALMSDLRADGGGGWGSRVSATGFEGRR